ncbi:MAG: toxin HigB [Pseudomonadota bacterium]|jgi:hypothetical protein
MPGYLSDDEYRALQAYLLRNPEAGDLVSGSGGVRKVRWAKEGAGKSGGIRVIYYFKKSAYEFWMLTLYKKAEQSTIPAHILKSIAESIKHEKS